MLHSSGEWSEQGGGVQIWVSRQVSSAATIALAGQGATCSWLGGREVRGGVWHGSSCHIILQEDNLDLEDVRGYTQRSVHSFN